MSSTIPMRVDGELFEAARSIGAIASRSAAQQISHWARIGRELENAPGTSLSDVQRVLAGDSGITYDNLNVTDQAVVRASWDEGVADRLSQLNFAEKFTREGSSWSEADEQGNVTVHAATKTSGLPDTE